MTGDSLHGKMQICTEDYITIYFLRIITEVDRTRNVFMEHMRTNSDTTIQFYFIWCEPYLFCSSDDHVCNCILYDQGQELQCLLKVKEDLS